MNLDFISKIIKLENERELQRILAENPTVLLSISEEWCSPCRAMEGTLMNAAFELEGRTVVVKSAVNTVSGLAATLDIKSIPAYIVYKQGEVVEILYGIQSIQALIGQFL
jgi:thioredoxin 1